MVILVGSVVLGFRIERGLVGSYRLGSVVEIEFMMQCGFEMQIGFVMMTS